MQNTTMQDLAKEIKKYLIRRNLAVLETTVIEETTAYCPKCITIFFKDACEEKFRINIIQSNNNLWDLQFDSNKKSGIDYELTDIKDPKSAWDNLKKWLDGQELNGYKIIDVKNNYCFGQNQKKSNGYCNII